MTLTPDRAQTFAGYNEAERVEGISPELRPVRPREQARPLGGAALKDMVPKELQIEDNPRIQVSDS